MSTDVLTANKKRLHMRPQSFAGARGGSFGLHPITTSDPLLEYCLGLAHQNMSPYLERRGEKFSDQRWRELAPNAEFYLIVDVADGAHKNVGFVSVRPEPDSPLALHIGDVQLEAAHQNRGAGSAGLQWIEHLAGSRGLTELTLNVFRDNPALRLYERFGFQLIDTQFYKYKMRKTLQLSTLPSHQHS